MRIRVNDEHIANGLRGHCRLCPIAMALKDAGVEFSTVGHYFLKVGADFITLPTSAREFIRLFDRMEYVQPFEFELEIL